MYSHDELQNELLYLNKDKNSDIMKEIYREQKWTLHRVRDDKFEYANSIELYKKFLKLISDCLKCVNVGDNSIILSVLIRTLIFNGYLSLDNKFNPASNQSFKDILSFEGIDVMIGKGCCRHLASFNKGVFDEMNIFNKIFTCYLGGEETTLEKSFTYQANHSANLIMYDDTMYGYDCYRNALFQAFDKFTMLRIMGEGKYDKDRLYYKPSANIMINMMSYEEAMERLKELEDNSKKKYISYLKYLNFKKEAEVIFDSNHDMFLDLKNEAKKYTKKMSFTLKEELSRASLEYYG